MNWISVKDRLPDTDRLVLCTDGENAKMGSWEADDQDELPVYYKWDICSCCAWIEGDVTHWSELSDLPKDVK